MTFLQYRTNLADFLSTGSTRLPDSVRKTLINLSRKYLLRRYDLVWGETTTSSSTVAGNQSVALPPLFSRPLDVYLLINNAKRQLNPLYGKEIFNAKYPDPTITGTPHDFTVWGTNLYFGPTPDAVYTYKIDFYGLPLDLSLDADEADMDVNAWEAVLYGAIVLAEPYMAEEERNPAWAQQAQNFEEAVVAEFRRGLRSATRPTSQEPG